MHDPKAALNSLRRPALLIQAARFSLSDYRRERDLRKLTRSAAMPSPDRALSILISEEEATEETRKTGASAYSATRHIALLTALMAEARLLADRPLAEPVA